MDWECDSVVKHLPSMGVARSLIPRMTYTYTYTYTDIHTDPEFDPQDDIHKYTHTGGGEQASKHHSLQKFR